MNETVIEMPGVGSVLEVRRKAEAPRKRGLRKHWPRLRVVAGQLVICVEK